ncbi:S8 family serine peptidase [uncultured Polaribacter sp.]|uniref:S8 family serine peptidase n=1 Tax=uncultured Polaribacter sp. TaxID=174711 RepID=UPI0026333E5A|nr:S8 family serine peptidase [uncultured Polaribacter sp.]
MNIIKPILYTAFAGVLLASCKSVSNIPVPSGTDNYINIPAKKGDLSPDEMNRWSHADLATDSIPGMSIDKAYEFLAGKTGVEVVVGVVDSGTDLTHEDLKDVAWVNTKEVANNNKDDDNNGYADDINGWNFLGSIYKENSEEARILDNPAITTAAEVARAKAAKAEKVGAAKMNKMRYEQMLQAVTGSIDEISKELNKEEFTKEEVFAIKTENPTLQRSIEIAKQMYGFGVPSLNTAKKELTNLVTDAANLLNNKAITNYRAVLKDDPNTMDVVVYGDGNTGHSTKDEAHGTHVSGIIAASRNNGKGVNGVANNAKIMAVRAVPDGDEYDKDIALAIRYAVDNGAKIINTSFGKGYSPKKEWVYDAIKYAGAKDVLIVNAAGNDGKDIDVEKTYPNDSANLVSEISDNVLTVGAMSVNYNENLPASFSNYGKRNVDIFAPGVQIYATFPENEYQSISGTSMAAPSTAGVAALIRSYYPKLSASQVKHIIMNSGVKINFDVVKPGSQSRENPNGVKVPFADLSVSGRIVNAYNALIMADRIANAKNKK